MITGCEAIICTSNIYVCRVDVYIYICVIVYMYITHNVQRKNECLVCGNFHWPLAFIRTINRPFPLYRWILQPSRTPPFCHPADSLRLVTLGVLYSSYFFTPVFFTHCKSLHSNFPRTWVIIYFKTLYLITSKDSNFWQSKYFLQSIF